MAWTDLRRVLAGVSSPSTGRAMASVAAGACVPVSTAAGCREVRAGEALASGDEVVIGADGTARRLHQRGQIYQL